MFGDKVIAGLKAKGVSDIKLIALVSETSSQVIFYGRINGSVYQSNNMVERNLIDSRTVDGVYQEVAEMVRNDSQFDGSGMNVVQLDEAARSVKFEHYERKCRVFKIISDWKKGVI